MLLSSYPMTQTNASLIINLPKLLHDNRPIALISITYNVKLTSQ